MNGRQCATLVLLIALVTAATAATWLQELPRDGTSTIAKVFNNPNTPASVFVIGTTTGQASSNVTNSGGNDVFVQRRNADTGVLELSTLFGGPGDEVAVSAAVDVGLNRICVIGTTTSNLGRPPKGVDGFLAILDAKTLEILIIRQFGTLTDDTVFDVARLLDNYVVFGTGGPDVGYPSGIFRFRLNVDDFGISNLKLEAEDQKVWVGIYSMFFSESNNVVFVGAEMTDLVNAASLGDGNKMQSFYLIRYEVPTLERRSRQVLYFNRSGSIIPMAPVSMDASSEYLYIGGESPGFRNPFVRKDVYTSNTGVAPSVARTELDVVERKMDVFGWNRVNKVNMTTHPEVVVVEDTVYYFRSLNTTKFDSVTFEYNSFLRNLEVGSPDRSEVNPSGRNIFFMKSVVYKDKSSGAFFVGLFGEGYGEEDPFTCDGGIAHSRLAIGQLLEMGGEFLESDPITYGSRCRERFSDATLSHDKNSYIFAGSTTGSLLNNEDGDGTNEIAFISAADREDFKTAPVEPICNSDCVTPTPTVSPPPTATPFPTPIPTAAQTPTNTASPSPSPTLIPTIPPVLVRGESSTKTSIWIVTAVTAGSAVIVGIASFLHYRFGESPQEY